MKRWTLLFECEKYEAEKRNLIRKLKSTKRQLNAIIFRKIVRKKEIINSILEGK